MCPASDHGSHLEPPTLRPSDTLRMKLRSRTSGGGPRGSFTARPLTASSWLCLIEMPSLQASVARRRRSTRRRWTSCDPCATSRPSCSPTGASACQRAEAPQPLSVHRSASCSILRERVGFRTCRSVFNCLGAAVGAFGALATSSRHRADGLHPARSERERTHAARHLPDDVPDGVKAARLQEVIAAFRAGLESRFAAGAEGHKIVRPLLFPLIRTVAGHNLPVSAPLGHARRTPSTLPLDPAQGRENCAASSVCSEAIGACSIGFDGCADRAP